MEGDAARVDPNTADLDTLRQLPGVGPALGQRIIEARPFTGLDDLRRVPGLGEAALARLAPHLRFAQEPEVMADAAAGGGALESEAEEATPAPAVQTALGRPPSRPITRTEVLRLAAAAAAASVVLSILLTLAILAGINGSLDAGRNRTVRQLRAQVDQASASIDAVSVSLESIDGRLQALEGLTGRMTTVEGQVGGMRADLEDALNQVGAMQTALSDLRSSMQDLEARAGRFDQFLEGLRNLLGATAAAPALEPSPVP